MNGHLHSRHGSEARRRRRPRSFETAVRRIFRKGVSPREAVQEASRRYPRLRDRFLERIGSSGERTRQLLTEIRKLRSKGELTDRELKRLAGLRAELNGLCSPERYLWADGVPVLDIVDELEKVMNAEAERTVIRSFVSPMSTGSRNALLTEANRRAEPKTEK
jgi:hypothetical protein